MSLQSLLLLALVGVTSVYASLHPTECGSLQRLMVGNDVGSSDASIVLPTLVLHSQKIFIESTVHYMNVTTEDAVRLLTYSCAHQTSLHEHCSCLRRC